MVGKPALIQFHDRIVRFLPEQIQQMGEGELREFDRLQWANAILRLMQSHLDYGQREK